MFRFFLLLSLMLFQWIHLVPVQASDISTGRVEGRLIDAETKMPLIGANILIINTVLGAASDMEGEFVIENVPVGNYSLQFRYIGYKSVIKTDVIIRPGRRSFVQAELNMAAISSDEVVVTAGYFNQKSDQPLSLANFSREEIRRAPGSAGDVSRIILGLPSLAKMDDQSNNLIVRGGSPLENTFYIDNMEMPNINHFPTQGASGGAIGILNVDLIEDVDFHTGGFSAVYGDKLSSIMNINFREGNRSRYDVQLDLNFAGFGGVAEGPLLNKGSWLVSARRSYLDFLVKTVNVGSTMAPSFGDYQGKLVYDLNPAHKLTLIGIYADEHNSPDQETAIENDMVFFGNQDNYQSMLGVNWQALWQKIGYSNTSITYNGARFVEDFYETGSGDPLGRNRSFEQSITFRNVNHFKLHPNHSLEIGAEIKALNSDFNNYQDEYSDAFGNLVPASYVLEEIREHKVSGFASYIFKPMPSLTTTMGFRSDYFSYNNNFHLSPRIAFSYQLNSRLKINGATGVYYQNLPLLLLVSSDRNRDLKDLYAVHYIAGMEYLLTASTRMTMEFYQKNYRDFPIDLTQPGLFLLDEVFYKQGYVFNNQQLNSVGKAYSRGIELMIQKKLARDFYGLASASFFRTRYQGADDTWRNRIFDNRLIVSIEGGYKPNSRWEFSLRWIYAGGRPFTPYDVEASQALNRGVYDESQINEDRYPAYHSLNVRFDRRFHFSRSNLILYLSVWNTYNRQNVSAYFWNQTENKQGTIYQFSMLPIFGLEFEF
ncbi:MAG: TonB-dependent receptor [Calditrichia bacterium]|nr:TonB-dependent receptor [Calditrichia bacterium]